MKFEKLLSVLVIDMIRQLWALAQCFTWKLKRSLSLYGLVTESPCNMKLNNSLCYLGIIDKLITQSQCKKLLKQITFSYFKFPMTMWTGRLCSSNTDSYDLYKLPQLSLWSVRQIKNFWKCLCKIHFKGVENLNCQYFTYWRIFWFGVLLVARMFSGQ